MVVACFSIVAVEAGFSTRVALACDVGQGAHISPRELHLLATAGTATADNADYMDEPTFPVDAADVLGAYRDTAVAVVNESDAGLGGHVIVTTRTWGNVDTTELSGFAWPPTLVADTNNCGFTNQPLDSVSYWILLADQTLPVSSTIGADDRVTEADLDALLGPSQPAPLPSDLQDLIDTLGPSDVGPVELSSLLDNEEIEVPESRVWFGTDLLLILAIIGLVGIGAVVGVALLFRRKR